MSQGRDEFSAWIAPDKTRAPKGIWDPDAVSERIPQANYGEEVAHELLGHVWGEMFGGHPAGTKANMDDALDAENDARAVDPSRKQKRRHHNYNEARD